MGLAWYSLERFRDDIQDWICFILLFGSPFQKENKDWKLIKPSFITCSCMWHFGLILNSFHRRSLHARASPWYPSWVESSKHIEAELNLEECRVKGSLIIWYLIWSLFKRTIKLSFLYELRLCDSPAMSTQANNIRSRNPNAMFVQTPVEAVCRICRPFDEVKDDPSSWILGGALGSDDGANVLF